MSVGKRGEEIACEYLVKKGHSILARNWRSGHLELDIISLDKEGLHFVEVKSRVAPVSAAPEENVGYTKQRKLIAAAKRYLHSKDMKEHLGGADVDISFDVISIVFEGEHIGINWFPRAYIPIYT